MALKRRDIRGNPRDSQTSDKGTHISDNSKKIDQKFKDYNASFFEVFLANYHFLIQVRIGLYIGSFFHKISRGAYWNEQESRKRSNVLCSMPQAAANSESPAKRQPPSVRTCERP